MRFATAMLIAFAGSTIGYAQQLERPPLLPPRPEKPAPPLFPSAPLDPRTAPSPPPAVRQYEAPQFPPAPLDPRTVPSLPSPVVVPPVVPQRSGPVCLKAVPVNPSIDRSFVIPIPENQQGTMRRLMMPPCVTLAPQSPD